MEKAKSELEQLYDQNIKIINEGDIIKGKITSIKTKEVLIDVDFKSEGMVPIAEFSKNDLELGKELDFFVESVEDDAGMILLSRQKAISIGNWDKILKASNDGSTIDGRPIKKVKGGFLVDVMGIEGFLPSSLSSFKGIADKDILYKEFSFKVVKLNNVRRSIILSRKKAMQKDKEAGREKLWQELKVGNVAGGVVKAITDFGAFVDLGGVDGLLHITDMSWSKINHPSEIVAVGDKIEVMILNVDKEAEKVSLGLKQRLPDPWQDIENKYTSGTKVKGKIVNIVPYGVFVELEKGIEALIHISEMSWTKRINNPAEMFAIGDMVEAQVLNVDKNTRRISLSTKQLEQNPWLDADTKYSVGTKVAGKVRGFTDYGAFIELDNSLEGMIHVSDMSWTKRVAHPQDILKKGQKVDVMVLSVDTQSRRIALGLKQLLPNPWTEIANQYPLEKILEVEVINTTDFGVFVKIDEDLEGLIYSAEIDKDDASKLKAGDKVKARIIKVDVEQAKIGLSARI